MVKIRRNNYQLAGLFVAAALLAYVATGAIFNDLYIPGRRGRGVHLHYDSIAPSALALICIAAKLALTSFKIERTELVQRTMTVLAAVFFAVAP